MSLYVFDDNVRFEPASSLLEIFPTPAIPHALDLERRLLRRADERGFSISQIEVKALEDRPCPKVLCPMFRGSA